MEVRDGLRVTRIRLGVARLTHFMRWLGLSKRSLTIAAEHAKQRMGGGQALLEHDW